MKTKKCTKCKEMKQYSEFHKDKSSKTGRQSKCKLCGLHVPWNLQVIPASENLKKSNRLIQELL